MNFQAFYTEWWIEYFGMVSLEQLLNETLRLDTVECLRPPCQGPEAVQLIWNYYG